LWEEWSGVAEGVGGGVGGGGGGGGGGGQQLGRRSALGCKYRNVTTETGRDPWDQRWRYQGRTGCSGLRFHSH